MNAFDSFPFLSFLVLAGALICKLSYLKKTRIQINSKKKRKGIFTWFLYSVFGLIFIIWLFEITKPVFQYSFPILPVALTRLLIQSYFLKISGIVFLLLSLILWTFTLIHFKNSLRFGLDKNNPGKLITTGIFSISRNPFFLSLHLYFIGITLIFTSLFFIGFTILAIISVHFFILKEEKFMRKVYGDEYKSYFGKARRYI